MILLMLAAAIQTVPAPLPKANVVRISKVAQPIDRATWLKDGDFANILLPDGGVRLSFALQVDAAGKVTACKITSTSGSVAFDDEACRILLARAKFLPAEDAAGKPRADIYRHRIAWSHRRL